MDVGTTIITIGIAAWFATVTGIEVTATATCIGAAIGIERIDGGLGGGGCFSEAVDVVSYRLAPDLRRAGPLATDHQRQEHALGIGSARAGR